MSGFSKLSSWVCSVACGVCLVLGLLTTPLTAKADPTNPPGGDGYALFCDMSFSYCVRPNCRTQTCLCEGGGWVCCRVPGSAQGAKCECSFGCIED